MKRARQLDLEIADGQERAVLERRARMLLDKWEPVLGVSVRELQIRKMRPFAGVNARDRRLWLSQALATASLADLEYVVVHELMHLLVGGHDSSFYELMDRHLPTWRRRDAHLRRRSS